MLDGTTLFGLVARAAPRALLALSIGLGTLAGFASCRTRPIDAADPSGSNPDGTSVVVDLGQSHDPHPVDILIVYSSENGTDSLRQRIRDAAPKLFAGLANVSDWHIGIVSADVGVGRSNVNNCSRTGDGGRLNPTQSPCNMQIPSFLAGSGSKPTNFSGDPAKVFAGCYVGEQPPVGCPYQQPWNAVIQALSLTTNPGFLRPDSNLGILFVVDTEDCSVPANTNLFSNQIMLPDGPARCFALGTVCMPAFTGAGTYSGCQIVPDTGALLGASEITKAILGAAPIHSVHVGILGGVTRDVTIHRDGSLDSVCDEGAGDQAFPTARLDGFSFDSDISLSASSSVCAPYDATFATLIKQVTP